MPGARRYLSQRIEAAIVIVGAFGYFVFGALYALFDGESTPHISEGHLEFLLIYEVVVSICLGTLLMRQGWTFRRIGLLPNVVDTLIGIALAAAFYLVYLAIWVAVTAMNVHPTYLGKGPLVAGHLSAAAALATSVVNGAFEEIFVCGYIVTVAKESRRLAAGVNASVAIRLAYHLYQGGVGVIGIIPFGLMCAWWFSRTGRLWPVIIAHAATDAAALLQFAA